MPELYGNPRKDELRKEIREFSNALNKEAKEHRETRDSLELALARIALLTKKIQLMEGKLKGLLAEASQEVSFDDVWDESERRRKARQEAMFASAESASA